MASGLLFIAMRWNSEVGDRLMRLLPPRAADAWVGEVDWSGMMLQLVLAFFDTCRGVRYSLCNPKASSSAFECFDEGGCRCMRLLHG